MHITCAAFLMFICKGGDGGGVWSWLSLKVRLGLAVCTFSEAPVSWAALVVLHTKTLCASVTQGRKSTPPPSPLITLVCSLLMVQRDHSEQNNGQKAFPNAFSTFTKADKIKTVLPDVWRE